MLRSLLMPQYSSGTPNPVVMTPLAGVPTSGGDKLRQRTGAALAIHCNNPAVTNPTCYIHSGPADATGMRAPSRATRCTLVMRMSSPAVNQQAKAEEIDEKAERADT